MTNLALVALAVLTLSACETNPTKKSDWECKAKGLANARYDGGKYAYIHLSSYSSGGNYSVATAGANKVAGKTQDGTPFECTKRQ